MIRKLFRLAALAAIVCAIVWLTRERLLPSPQMSGEPPPRYRSTPPPPPITDDLTAIKGIGPVYASRLNDMGVQSFRALSEISPETVAATLGVAASVATDWIAQARARIS